MSTSCRIEQQIFPLNPSHCCCFFYQVITAASEPLTTDFFLPQLWAIIALKEDSMNAYHYASEDSETLEVYYSTYEKLLFLSYI